MPEIAPNSSSSYLIDEMMKIILYLVFLRYCKMYFSDFFKPYFSVCGSCICQIVLMARKMMLIRRWGKLGNKACEVESLLSIGPRMGQDRQHPLTTISLPIEKILTTHLKCAAVKKTLTSFDHVSFLECIKIKLNPAPL